jgi:hypothetical protein
MNTAVYDFTHITKLEHLQKKLLGTQLYIIPNYSQQDATFLYLFILTDALHASGGSSAHHQEHITVHIASGSVN